MSAPTSFPLQHSAASSFFQNLKEVQGTHKRGRGKAVSWPPEDQICQTRFFGPDDVPSSISGCNFSSSNQALVPTSTHALQGFRSSLVKRARMTTCMEAPMDIAMPWVCPEKIVCNSEWLVVDGDASSEALLQQQREVRLLEAFYPRTTAIPYSPAEPAEALTAVDDCLIPVIPLSPIEEDDENMLKQQDASVNDCCLLDELSAHVESDDHAAPKANPAHSEESNLYGQGMSSASADGKPVAAAAASIAFQRNLDIGRDANLIVEILGNSTLPSHSDVLNRSLKDETVNMEGFPQTNSDHTQAHSCERPASKASRGPLNTGLPSPVSVLSDWTQGHARNCRNIQSKLCENIIPCQLPRVPDSSLHHTAFRTDSVPVVTSIARRYSAQSKEVNVFSNTSLRLSHGMQRASSATPGSSRTLAILPPAESISVNMPTLGCVQSLPCRYSQAGLAYQGMPIRNGLPCKVLLAEGSPKFSENPQAYVMSKSGLRNNRLCMYFNTPRGCRYGENCSFLHQMGHVEPNTVAK